MNFAIFIKFASVSFQQRITYRFDYFMGILNGFLYVFIFTSLWQALFAHSDLGQRGGFSLTGILTYAVVAMAVRIAFSMDDSAIYKKVQDGSVAMDLIRPVSFFYMTLAESVGYSMFHTVARSIPIIVISALMFDISIPADPVRLFAFTVSALLGYLILFMINFAMGLLAFWFVEVFPFMLFKYGLFTLFAGGIVPIDFFPAGLKLLVNLMPFQHILYVPTVILTGHASLDRLPEMLSAQMIWLLVLAGLCKVMWNAGRDKLIIQGG